MRNYSGFHIDRFSTVDHLTNKQLKDDATVLAVLRKTPRVSCFEMSEMKGVYRAIRRLEALGKITTDGNKLEYPWIAVTIIEPPSREDTDLAAPIGSVKDR
jgi:NADPH-dependent glutamate synthase beta subunit-like oxidoreductase